MQLSIVAPALLLIGILALGASFIIPEGDAASSGWTKEQAEQKSKNVVKLHTLAEQKGSNASEISALKKKKDAAKKEQARLKTELEAAQSSKVLWQNIAKYGGVSLVLVGVGLHFMGQRSGA